MTAPSATDELTWAAGFDASQASDADGIPMLDVPAARWFDVIEAAQQAGLGRWEFLTAIDEADGTFCVVVHLLGGEAVTGGPEGEAGVRGVFLRTRVADGAPLSSVVDLFPGAAWHQREATEMFGVAFEVIPFEGDALRGAVIDDAASDLLLLGPESPAHPMLKTSWLSRRQDRPWPGAKEPGESDADPDEGSMTAQRPTRRRRRQTTFGVDPTSEVDDG